MHFIPPMTNFTGCFYITITALGLSSPCFCVLKVSSMRTPIENMLLTTVPVDLTEVTVISPW